MKHATTLMMILLTTPAVSETKRQLDAHEHGVGALNIAIDGTAVEMEFRAPGADIVGFEHAAESAEDRAAIDNAVAILAKPTALFVLPAEAACSVVQARAELETDDGREEHGHSEHDEHNEHDHEEHATHEEHDHDAHEDHAEHDHDEHDHDEHAEHDGHDEGASHSEFHAAYTLNCASPDKVTGIDFVYFETFENARELEIQIVSPSGAQAFDVSRDAPRLDLSSLF